MEQHQHEPSAALPVLTDEALDQLIDALRSDPQALATFVERATPDSGRGRGEEQTAQALLDAPRDGQLGQLPLCESPTEAAAETSADDTEHCWFDGERWLTTFPPPAGFAGYRRGKWRDWNYERECTPDEVALLEASQAVIEAEELETEAARRDAWFATLAQELAAIQIDEVADTPADGRNALEADDLL